MMNTAKSTRTSAIVAYLAIGTVVMALTIPSKANSVPLEAAFQGRCEHGNPCDHICFNIHDEIFECYCREGFTLHDNGYSCISLNSTSSTSQSVSSSELPQSKSPSKMSIQIEVDIDPPPVGSDNPDAPSEEALAKLGLPTKHVHFSTKGSGPEEEILRPEDISIITYQNDDLKDYQSKSGDQDKVEPPRVLPMTNSTDDMVHGEEIFAATTTTTEESTSSEYKDKVFEIDAFCNLNCGAEGECFMAREGSVIKKRCLCPHGKFGEKCALDRIISAPFFSGHSYLALPTLTNAYSDLQLSMEFKPETKEGILLLTGETPDLSGDYLALLIKDGHVELRLDCGTGPGVVRTRDQVHLNQWNLLTVYRHDWGVWLQLNGGIHEEGRSQGLFSRITFAQPVQLGGSGSFKNTRHFLDTESGFQGCIRMLEINNKHYNFEPAERDGDALFGIDIDECSEDSCSSVPCQNGGLCTPMPGHVASSGAGECQCPLGYTGQFCEKAVEIQVPSFIGSSYLTYFGLADSSLLWNELEIVFKAEANDGLLLYNGDHNDGTGDFMALFLNRGYLEFAFDNGDGVAIVSSQYPVKLNTWQTASVSRTGRLAFLSLEGQDTQSRMASGAFNELRLNQNLYLGGVPTFNLVSSFVPIRTAFKGCVQKLAVNEANLRLIHAAIDGYNVKPCEHPCSAPAGHPSPCGSSGTCRPQGQDFTCDCPLGHAGVHCEKTLDLNSSFSGKITPSFGGDGFLHLKNEDLTKNILGITTSISLRLRVYSTNGLILWTGGERFSAASDFLMIGVKDGFVNFRYNLGSGEGILVFNDTRVDDGKWHRIRVTRTEQTATLLVDNGHKISGSSPGKLRQLNGNGHIFIGGTEDLEHFPLISFRSGLVGCVSDLSIGQVFDINLMETASSGRNVENCKDTFSSDVH